MTATVSSPSRHPSTNLTRLAGQRMHAFRHERWQQEWRGRHIMRGRTPGADAIMLVSNDYLAIANHPTIVDAQIRTLSGTGESVLMSGVFLHGDTPQSRLEQRFCRWTGMAEAILSQSGYAANVGLIQALADAATPVYIDMHAHASLWEGIQSAGAVARPWRHNDLAHLRRQLAAHGPGIVCVDSVYSTNGSVCRLRDTVQLARAMGCVVIVDESHSLGTHGPGGAGLVAAEGLTAEVDFITASLAKAFAGRAGLILCPQGFSDYFWFTARPAIFSSCLLPHEIAALDSTLDVIIAADDRREALHRNAALVREGLDELGFNVEASQSQIIALEAGLEYDTLCLREALEARNVFGSVFCAPATPKKRSLIRFSIHAGMTIAQIEQLLAACADVRQPLEVWKWPSSRRKQGGQPLQSVIGL